MWNKKNKSISNLDELTTLLNIIKNNPEIKAILNDLFTEKEIATLANRWRVAKMLHAGMSWKKISEVTGVSSATISNIHKKIQNKNTALYHLLDKTRFNSPL